MLQDKNSPYKIHKEFVVHRESDKFSNEVSRLTNELYDEIGSTSMGIKVRVGYNEKNKTYSIEFDHPLGISDKGEKEVSLLMRADLDFSRGEAIGTFYREGFKNQQAVLRALDSAIYGVREAKKIHPEETSWANKGPKSPKEHAMVKRDSPYRS